jgi:hypothetical protein
MRVAIWQDLVSCDNSTSSPTSRKNLACPDDSPVQPLASHCKAQPNALGRSNCRAAPSDRVKATGNSRSQLAYRGADQLDVLAKCSATWIATALSWEMTPKYGRQAALISTPFTLNEDGTLDLISHFHRGRGSIR